jgi:hypothetical protein
METTTTEPWDQVDALEAGRGFADRSGDRMLIVTGADARGWLGDLVTADVATLERGSSRRSLLLSPTGRIRADLVLAQIAADVFMVLQPGDQPEAIHELLRPYVLSSSVRLEDATGSLAAIAFPEPGEVLTGPLDDLSSMLRATTGAGGVLVDDRSTELWRITRGNPRMGADFEAGALPAEAGLERAIDLEKGCFLGQESVAKVRNLGHPPTVLRHLRSEGVTERGTEIQAAGEVVGLVTSVAPGRNGGSVIIGQVAWRAADAALQRADGSTLFPLPD